MTKNKKSASNGRQASVKKSPLANSGNGDTDPSANKNQEITQSLDDTAAAIDDLKADLEKRLKVPGKHTLAIEDRISSIQSEVATISDKMLAYKLRRVADSKMLESVSALANLPQEASRSKLGKPSAAEAPKSKPKSKNKTKSKEGDGPEYLSSTFQCKGDLDLCMLGATSALDKALCYALFIRCAIKG